MECKKCGRYYPSDEKCCPWCNHKVDAADNRKIRSVELLRVDTRRARSENGALFRVLIARQLGGRYASAMSALRSATMMRRDAVFRVEYESGRVSIETAKVDGLRYMKLMSLAE